MLICQNYYFKRVRIQLIDVPVLKILATELLGVIDHPRLNLVPLDLLDLGSVISLVQVSRLMRFTIWQRKVLLVRL